MSSTASLVFDIVGKDHASSALDKTGKSASSAGDKMKAFAKAGAVAGLALGALAFSAAKAAIVDQKAQALLAKQLVNSAGATREQVAATEDWISKQGIAFGVTDDDLRPALAKMVAVTHDVGKAQMLASLAMDVSAGTGKSLSTVSAALAKAQLGQVSGLSKLGIATKNADGSTKSLDDITKQMAKTYAGAASTAANTAQGKFDRLKLIFDETKESVGYKLLPVLTSLATFLLTKVGPAISNVTGFLKEHKTWILAAATAIGALIVVTAAHAVVLNVAAAGGLAKYIASTRIVTALTKTWAAVQWLLNAALSANPIGLVIIAIAALAAGVYIAYKKSETFRNGVKMLGSGLLMMGEFGVKAFRFLLTAAFAVFEGILYAADKGLGWVPGLGDKIHSAREEFTEFGDSTIEKLKGVEDGLHRTRDAINGLDGKRARIDVDVHYNVAGPLKNLGIGATVPPGAAAPRSSPYTQTGQMP